MADCCGGDSPASVTDGVGPVTATGDKPADIAELVDAFAGDLTRAYMVGNPKTITMMAGQDFPYCGARGGEVATIPVLTSRSVPADILALVDPTGIAMPGGGVSVRVSREGTLEMLDEVTQQSMEPGSPDVGPTPSSVVSLWQTHSVEFLTEISVNWSSVRPGSVAVLDTTAWLAVNSPPE